MSVADGMPVLGPVLGVAYPSGIVAPFIERCPVREWRAYNRALLAGDDGREPITGLVREEQTGVPDAFGYSA